MSMAQLFFHKFSGKPAAFAVALILALGAAESASAGTRVPDRGGATLSGSAVPGELLQQVHQQRGPWWRHPAGRKQVQPHHFQSRRHFRPHHVRPYPGGNGCRRATVVDYHCGRKALFGSVVCFNRYGRAYVLPGSRHLIRHLHH